MSDPMGCFTSPSNIKLNTNLGKICLELFPEASLRVANNYKFWEGHVREMMLEGDVFGGQMVPQPPG